MVHLIAYDITSGRRLRKVARICEDYGVRVEKSVFECRLSESDFAMFWKCLADVVSDGDNVIDYPIGLLDQKKIQTLGGAKRYEPENTYVF